MALLDPIRARAISRGVFGNSRTWLVVGGIAWGIRALSWVRRPNEATLFRQAIEPGETLVITASGPPPTKRQHRRSLKAEKQLARRERREQIATARARHRHRVL